MRISVISINLNNLQGLKKTASSVFNQSYENIEYIIIDGGSTDGSLNFIKEEKDKIHYWISEKDNGIYDAMNKGIRRVTGDWIIFLNSGDYFLQSSSLKNMHDSGIMNKKGLIYADCFAEYKDGHRELRKVFRGPDEVWKGPIFRHNTMLISANIQKQFPYKVNKILNTAADFDFIYKMYKKEIPFIYYSDEPLIVYEHGGISYNPWNSYKYNYLIHIKHEPFFNQRHRYHLMKLLKYQLRKWRNKIFKVDKPVY